MNKAKYSVTKWKGKFINYYGENGAVYIDTVDKIIRTGFKSEEFQDNDIRRLEVLKKNGR